MKNNIRKIGKWVRYLVIILVVVIILNNILTRFDSVFKVAGFRSYTILTGSMEPKIMPGDLAVVKSINVDKLSINDVITFKYQGNVITHRIVDIKNGGFITKGDNNNVEDREVVKKDNIIGRVNFIIPKMGFLMIRLSNPIIMISILLLLIVIILKETFTNEKSNKILAEKIDNC